MLKNIKVYVFGLQGFHVLEKQLLKGCNEILIKEGIYKVKLYDGDES